MSSTLQSILVVHLNPLPGRDSDFDQWWTYVHIRDVMCLTGSLGVQRFRRHRHQLHHDAQTHIPHHEWLTIYEIANTRASVAEHLRDGATERMPISDGAEYETVSDYYFDPVSPLPRYNPERGFRPADDILGSRLAVDPASVDRFERWFVEEHAESMLQTGAALTASLFRFSDTQMMKTPPFNNYFAVYSVADTRGALDQWASLIRKRPARESLGYDSAFEFGPHAEATIGCYGPVTPRITAESVLNAPPGERAVADQVRIALAGHMLSSKPMGL